jgi:hypothetical protein
MGCACLFSGTEEIYEKYLNPLHSCIKAQVILPQSGRVITSLSKEAQKHILLKVTEN